MSSASFSVDIARPRDEVFAYVADLRNTPRWMSFVDDVELVAGTPGTVGARYLVTNEQGILDDVVVDYATEAVDPGSTVRFAVEHPKLSGHDTYTVEDAGDGRTRVTYATEVSFKGINKLTTPIGALALKAGAHGLDGHLREVLERDDRG
jgi:uncharacterized protein YndB with AHSA1/START domain